MAQYALKTTIVKPIESNNFGELFPGFGNFRQISKICSVLCRNTRQLKIRGR